MTFRYLGLDHVQLAAPEGCEAEARRFYSGLLGWIEIEKPDSLKPRGGVWFRCGAHQVHIGVQKDFVPAVKAHPAFQVRQLDDLREMLLRGGADLLDDTARDEEGVKRFYLTDPFGNRLEFLEWQNEGTGGSRDE